MACYLIDLDGTIYCGPRPLPYAAEFIRRLNRRGGPTGFLPTRRNEAPGLVERELRRMGIPAEKGSVLSAGTLSVEYLAGSQKRTGPFGYASWETGISAGWPPSKASSSPIRTRTGCWYPLGRKSPLEKSARPAG